MPHSTRIPFAERLKNVQDRIGAAAQKSGRAPSDIKLVAVTKSADAETVLRAYDAGLRVFGENRIQETEPKILNLNRPDVEWHMVGHLQSNKVKAAVSLFQMIQSVDSVRLAEKINVESMAGPKPVLLEINISGEAQKYGFKPEEIYTAIEGVSAFPNIRVLGLMGMAPNGVPDEIKRAAFKKLRSIFSVCKTLKKDNIKMQTLSMRMSYDFEIAIEEGSNMVRLGRILFS